MIIEKIVCSIFLIIGIILSILGIFITINTKEYYFLVMLFLGVIYLIIGGSYFLNSILYKIKYNRLKKNGKLIKTDFEYIEVNYRYNINGKSPIRIVTSYFYEGESYTFYSKNLWIDKDTIIKGNIDVYVNKDNYKDYVMDYKENK